MNFSSDAMADFEGLLEVNRKICKQQMAEKASPTLPTNCAVLPEVFHALMRLFSLHKIVFFECPTSYRAFFFAVFGSSESVCKVKQMSPPLHRMTAEALHPPLQGGYQHVSR